MIEPWTTTEINYASYLRIPELLDLQSLRSEPPHPEELHFIVTHQAIELWFKLVLHDLGRVVAAMDATPGPPRSSSSAA